MANEVKVCTSESYDFMNIPFDIDRGKDFLETAVAVVDGCRKMTKACDSEELSFLSDPKGLVDYKAVSEVCLACTKNHSMPLEVGINGHGFFCAAIIASQRIQDAQMNELYLGSLRGISPPPKIALYAVGCPSCLEMREQNMADGIHAATAKGVSVISMSLASLPAYMREPESPDFHLSDMAALDALRADIVTVVSAGNMGKTLLRSVAKSAPWCLSVASCTSKTVFKTTVAFKSNLAKRSNDFEFEVQSLYVFPVKDWTTLRMDGEINDCSCIMYYEESSGQVVIIADSFNEENAPNDLFAIRIPREQSVLFSSQLAKGKLYVQIKPPSRADVADTPLVSPFSSRGPCSYYVDIMKPNLSAPGEMIAAAWPTDVLVRGVDGYFATEFNVLSGTSFSVPQVAAAIAALRAQTRFSALETISAVITTAKKMHWKEPIAWEYAYGGGMLDLRRAMRPGLIYEDSVHNYSLWLGGDVSHLLLNLPYFSATFPSANKAWQCEFRRKVKSVEVSECKYKATVNVHYTSLNMPLESIRITTSKKDLTFTGYGDEEEFTLVVELPHTKDPPHNFGLISASLIWTNEENETIVVDSPIILSSKTVPPYHIMEHVYSSAGFKF